MGTKESNTVNFNHSDIANVQQLLAVFPILFESSLDNVLVHDAQGTPIYSNPSMLKTLNMEHEALVLKLFTERQNSAVSPYSNHIRQVLKTGQACSLVVEMHDPIFSRDIFDLLHFSPIKNKQQQILGVVVTGRDLDFLKQKHHEEIKRREYNMRVLLDSLPLILWMKDKQHQLLVVNQHYADLVEANNVYELEGKTDFDLFNAVIAQSHVDDANQVIQTGSDKHTIEQIRRPNGQTYWAYTHKLPLKIDDEIIGTVGFSRDISVERSLKEELDERENEYKTLIDNIPAAIMVYDLECRRILVNEWYSELIKRPGAASLGKKPTEHWSPNVVNLSGERYEQYLQDVITTGKSVTVDMIMCKDDFGITVHDVKIVPRKNTHGKVSGVIAIVNDVTKIYQAQQQNKYLDT